MTYSDIKKQATESQIQKLSSLIATAKKFGNTGDILSAQFSEHGVLAVEYEGLGGFPQFVMIGKRGANIE